MQVRRMFAAAAVAAVALASSQASAQSLNPWTGFYLGAHAGYVSAADTDPKVKGFAGGIQGGYNWQFNQIVAGIEGDYTLSGADSSSTISGVTVKAGIDSLWSVRGRLGFLAANNLMIYGTAGYGGFDMSAKALGSEVSARARGFVAGGGVEYAFTRNFLGRIEGLHYMGEGTGSFSGLEQDVTVFRAGLSYKF